MPKLPQHIEERFDNQFEDYGGEYSSNIDAPRSMIKSFIATILEEATKEAVDGVLEKMKPYTITGNRDMYCATFTIEQFKQILNYQSNKRR